MKALWMSLVALFIVIAAGLGLYFGVYRKPERRAKVANFFISIGNGIKKYTTDLFKKSEGNVPESDVVPA